MDGHLNARFGTSALEHDVEAVGLVELAESRSYGLLGAAELVLRRLRLVRDGQAVHLLREAVLLRKVEPRLVDVDRDDLVRAVRLGKRAREEADRTNAEDEHGCGPLCGEIRAAGGMKEDGERLGKRGLLKRAVVR